MTNKFVLLDETILESSFYELLITLHNLLAQLLLTAKILKI